MIQVYDLLAGGDETALLHDSAGGRIVNEVAADQRFDLRRLTDVVYHQPKRLCADAPVPVGSGHPVADERFSLPGREIALAGRSVTHGADGFSGFFQHDGPGAGGVVEYGPDNLQTLLHAFVRRPAGTGTDFRIRGVFEQRLGVVFHPGTK